MSVKHPSVIIIGSGISGLTAAYELQKAEFQVTVLEAGTRVGGAMYSQVEDEWIAEIGPNSILETHEKIKTLIHELEITEEVIYPGNMSSNRFVIKNHKLLPLPMSPISFFTSGLFSLNSKLNLLREPFISKWDNHKEESLADFVRRRLGQNFLDYAVNPFIAGVYAGNPESLSVKYALPKLYGLEQKYSSLIKGQIKKAREPAVHGEIPRNSAKMFSFKNGLKTLPETIANKLQQKVQFDSQIKSIEKKGEEWSVRYQHKGDDQILQSSVIIYAGTAHQLSKLPIKNTNLTFAEDIIHPPVAVLSLGYHRNQVKHHLNGFGMLIPEVEKMNILGALFMSSLFKGRTPQDHVLLTVFLGGTRQPHMALQSEEQRLISTEKDLSTLLGINSAPSFIFHRQWEKAIPQYGIGFGEIKSTFHRLEKANPGLYFTGNYREGISVSDTILHALKTAEIIKSNYKSKLI
ncbi:MAG: protoporphyrinogen oxidase [Candidatus Marinimicrobia bacterium]|nr:protoporphyrinogen oxidase [Candidatus Neomarinimicrobiota bacterium]